jgi:flagellar hook-associated protein 2
MGSIRIGGIASGMDIDSLVSELMKVERAPLDKMLQNKQLLEWKRDDYREMNKLLDELDQKIFYGVWLQGNMLSKKVTSSDESIVSATASPSAINTSVQVKVNKVATAATWVSNDVTFSKDNFTSADTTLTFKVKKPGDTTEKTVTIDITSSDTFDDVLSKLNSNSDLGISVFHDNVPGNEKVVITSKNTGAGASIVVGDDATGNFLLKLGFKNGAGTGALVADEALSGMIASGEDADFEINGYRTTRSSNTFEINGVTYTLKQASASTVTIGITSDVDKAVETITNFVTKYNEVIDKINSKVNEKRYRSYQPLLEEQKKAMSEKEIELWEEKAKSGLLNNDRILTSGLIEMRRFLSDPVQPGTIGIDSNYDTLAEIGITTSKLYQDRGKLSIDEVKLREALEANPEAVYNLFNKKADDPSVGKKLRKDRTAAEHQTYIEQSGLAVRLRDSIKNIIYNVETQAGNIYSSSASYFLGRELDSLDKRIDDFQERLNQIENRYWAQFTAMEKAIQKANEQSAYLMNAFGGGV